MRVGDSTRVVYCAAAVLIEAAKPITKRLMLARKT
jgi:hypothetical protein